MLGIYFSGTGNSKYCLDIFLNEFAEHIPMLPIENVSIEEEIKKHNEIVFAYPTQYSNLPKIVKDFVLTHKSLWEGKRIFIIVTMGLFCGDGAGVLARLLKKQNAMIVGGLHVKMPDCIADEKLLKHTFEKNKQCMSRAKEKVIHSATKYKEGHPTKEGLGVIHHFIGFFSQRLYFSHKVSHYRNDLKIDKEKCSSCGLCVNLCPMNNLTLSNQHVAISNQCTMCYRCINQCPKQAITLLGKQIHSQHHIDEYME